MKINKKPPGGMWDREARRDVPADSLLRQADASVRQNELDEDEAELVI